MALACSCRHRVTGVNERNKLVPNTIHDWSTEVIIVRPLDELTRRPEVRTPQSSHLSTAHAASIFQSQCFNELRSAPCPPTGERAMTRP